MSNLLPLRTSRFRARFEPHMKHLDVPKSGSLGQFTYSRGRSGQYMRSRSLPTNPRTSTQVAARSALGTQSAAWRGLTDAQRAAWNAFAGSFTKVNSLGTSISLTGHQCFTKINSVNLKNGDATVNTPPTLPAFAACTVTALTYTAGTPALKLAGTSPTSPCKYMIYASGQKSAGASYCSDFRYIQTFTTATTGFFDILTAYTAKFGALIVGKKVFVKVVQAINGFQDHGTTFAGVAAT